MTKPYYVLPEDLAADIDTYEQEVRGFLDGSITDSVLKAKRVPRGVYEQRQDGVYMVRVRIAGGTLTSEQARTLGKVASEYGDGRLHVTTRQDVQIHDVAIAETPDIMRRLLEVGLTSKGGGGNTVRNITACPYAGICRHECFDVTPLAHAATEYLITLVGSYNLPRKYKIAFSGCAVDCALAQVSDLGFVAAERDGEPGFRVFAGGGMGAHSRLADELFDWLPVSEVIRVAEALRRFFDKHGDRENRSRARLRFVFERLGLEAVREELAGLLEDVARDGVPVWEGEVTRNEAPESPPGRGPGLENVDGVRCLVQRQDGLVAVPLNLPLGFVDAAVFEEIAAIAENYSEEGGVRATRSQNLLIRGVRKVRVAGLTDALRALDLDVLEAAPLARFVACAGASTCRMGLCLARGAARACAEELSKSDSLAGVLDELDIHINGCPNACGQQPIGAIGFYGVAPRHGGRLVPSYRATVAGGCGSTGARLGRTIGTVAAKAMPAFVHELVQDFQSGRQDDESFVSYCDRVGEAHFEALVSQHDAVPAYGDVPEFYRDFGADEDFSLAGRRAGECGAGVFEVIRKDIAEAESAEKTFDVLVPTARALLITRGVDASDPVQIFSQFEKHFMNTGLVSSEFKELLSRAADSAPGKTGGLDQDAGLVGRLLERVKLLFSTLDGNLEFHPPDGGEAVAEVSTSTSYDRDEEADASPGAGAELDLSGVACPMNFVKAKLKLEELSVGDSLAVVLDDGAPVQNVPASFRGEGQEIEETTDLGDGHWRVVVKKLV